MAKPSVRAARRIAALLVLPTLAGCPLQNFDVDQDGMAGRAATSGGAPFGTGGAPNPGGAAGAGGADEHTTAPRLTEDAYVVAQGEELWVPFERGLLSNDVPVRMTATLFRKPLESEGELTLSSDGSFHFIPAARFFGTCTFSYEARTSDGQSALEDGQIRVTPRDVDLEVLADGVGGFVIYGPEEAGLGSALDRGNDVDRDGRRDLLLGAPTAGMGDGAVFVVFGKSDRAALELALTVPEGAPAPYVALRAGALEGLGNSVSWVGDMDGDRASEVVLGASGGAGRAYVVPGSELSGLVELPSPGSTVIEGDPDDEELGRLVRGAGDVDGDMIPDVLVTSQRLSTGWLNVLLGPLPPGSARVSDFSSLSMRGAPDERFPIAAVATGDLDGDGAAEIFASSDTSFVLLRRVMNEPDEVQYQEYLGDLRSDGSRGTGWRVTRSESGDAAVASLFDVNGDGVPDLGSCDGTDVCSVIFGPPTVLVPGWSFSGFSSRRNRISISGGGDVDGDGLADILLLDDRAAYVVFGTRGQHEDVDLRALGPRGFVLHPGSSGRVSAAAIVGDVNGDNIADLAIGDATADGGAGRVYVVFGVSSR